MAHNRPVSLALTFLAVFFFVLPPAAFAREGTPYRGPTELLGGGGGGDDSSDPGGDGGGGEGGGEGGGGEGGGEGGEGGGAPAPAPGGGGGVPGPGGGNRTARVDGSIVWSWWWEHNKDRFLARATEKGRVNADSAYYWFGAGAKFPPRQVDPVSDAQRGKIFDTLLKTLQDKSGAVRAEACIAIARLGKVRVADDQKQEGLSDNRVVRALIQVIENESGQTPQSREIRQSALLGLGICGDADGCAYLMRNYKNLTTDDQAYACIAFGLARYVPAVPLLLDDLPHNATKPADDSQLAALHAIGLYGPDVVPELNKDKRDGVERITKYVRRGHEPTVVQAVMTLGRLRVERKTVEKGLRLKANNVEWTALLALANFHDDEKEAAAAYKTLKSNSERGKGQTKNFAVLALGELARQIDPNSKVRADILKQLRSKKGGLEQNDNYIRACAAIALGVAGDETAVPLIVELLSDTTVDNQVRGAACVSLGLLRATDHAGTIKTQVLRGSGNADAKGYALVGLALMGDTTQVDEITKFAAGGTVAKETDRQVPLALSVLGDKKNVSQLVGYFDKEWKSKKQFTVSNAAYGLGWAKDASAVDSLVKLATKSPNESVRALATIALGYVATPRPTNVLSRVYENANYRNRFAQWDFLYGLSRIL